MIKQLNLKKNLSLAVLIFCVGMAVMYDIRRVFINALDFTVMFSIFAAILFAGFCFAVWYIISKNGDYVKVLIISVTAISLLYMLMFPPITVPDEQLHYLSAYRISNYFLFDFSQFGSDMLFIRECDYEFFLKLEANSSKQYLENIYGNIEMFAKSADVIKVESDYVANAPFGYLVSALGIAVARLLSLGAFPAVILARLMNIAAFTAMLVFSVKRIPSGKIALVLIAALPMTLHLTASLSYDSLVLAFAFTFIAQVMYIRSKPEKADTKDIILLLLFAVLLAPSKLVYLPLVFILLIIPNDRFAVSAKKAVAIKLAVIGTAIAVFLVLQLSTFIDTATDTASGWSDEPSYSFGWILQNPIGALKVVLNTIKYNSPGYFWGMFGKSLGWMDVVLPTVFCATHAALIALSFMQRDNESLIIHFTDKVWITLCVIGSAGLVLLSMFIAWTPMGSDVIYGVQGRYFLPLLLPLFFVVRNKFITVKRSLDKYIVILSLAVIMLTAMEVFISVAK